MSLIILLYEIRINSNYYNFNKIHLFLSNALKNIFQFQQKLVSIFDFFYEFLRIFFNLFSCDIYYRKESQTRNLIDIICQTFEVIKGLDFVSKVLIIF